MAKDVEVARLLQQREVKLSKGYYYDPELVRLRDLAQDAYEEVHKYRFRVLYNGDIRNARRVMNEQEARQEAKLRKIAHEAWRSYEDVHEALRVAAWRDEWEAERQAAAAHG